METKQRSAAEPEPATGVPAAPAPPPPPSGLLNRAWRLIKVVFAFTIIFLAFLLGFVPGIPGWPLALFGLSLLAAEFVWARQLLKRIQSGAGRLKDAALLRRRKNGREQPKV